MNEDDSIHKMKVVNEDSSNQNKASEVGVKIMKEGLANKEEEQAVRLSLVPHCIKDITQNKTYYNNQRDLNSI